MKKTFVLLRFGFLATSLFTGAAVMRAAEDLGAVRSRMEQRIGPVNVLKDRGAVGENVQYFAHDAGGRELAVMVFGAAAPFSSSRVGAIATVAQLHGFQRAPI